MHCSRSELAAAPYHHWRNPGGEHFEQGCYSFIQITQYAKLFWTADQTNWPLQWIFFINVIATGHTVSTSNLFRRMGGSFTHETDAFSCDQINGKQCMSKTGLWIKSNNRTEMHQYVSLMRFYEKTASSNQILALRKIPALFSLCLYKV